MGIITAVGGIVTVLTTLYRTRSSTDDKVAPHYRELVDDLNEQLDKERARTELLERQLAACRRTKTKRDPA